MDVRAGSEPAFKQDDRLVAPEYLQACARAPGEHGVHGGFEPHRSHSVARPEEGIGAGCDLLDRVLACVAHNVRGGRAEGVHAALLEPEHRPGHGLDEARCLRHP